MTRTLLHSLPRGDAPVDPLHLTLEQGLDRFCAQGLSRRTLALRTRVEYVADVQDALAYLQEQRGVRHVTAVIPSYLEGYLGHLAQRGLKASTRRRKATSLRVFFRFLRQQGYLPASPADGLVPPALEDHQPRVLTEAEYQHLLAAARYHPRDLAILELFLQTGIRRSELKKPPGDRNRVAGNVASW